MTEGIYRASKICKPVAQTDQTASKQVPGQQVSVNVKACISCSIPLNMKIKIVALLFVIKCN